MNSLVVSGILLASALAGLFVGVFLRKVLPNPHLDSDCKDVVKMGTGLVAAVTGLVLGLLTASAKSSYDSQRENLRQMAANTVLLGPRPAAVRARGRRDTRPAPHDGEIVHRPPLARECVSARRTRRPRVRPANSLVTSRESIRNLPAKSESQISIKSHEPFQLTMELGKARWQLHRWEDSSIPVPFLVILNFWLAILFLSFGLFTPRNATVLAVLFVCAVSVAGALFLIVELDQPFAGLVRISSAPLNNALTQIGK